MRGDFRYSHLRRSPVFESKHFIPPGIRFLLGSLLIVSACANEIPQSEVVLSDGLEVRLNYRPVEDYQPGETTPAEDVFLFDGTETTQPADWPIQFQQLEVGPDSTIYVLDDRADEVKAYDHNGVFIRTIGTPGSGPGEFAGPRFLYVIRDQMLAVQETGGGVVHFFDLDGTYLERIRFPGHFWMVLAHEREAGYFMLNRRREGSAQTGETEWVFLQRLDERGSPTPFDGASDTLEIGVIHHPSEPVLTRRYPNSRTIFALRDGDILALAPHYTFVRVGAQGRRSAFRRVADPVLFPDWWLEEYRRDWMERRNAEPPRLRGYHSRPYTMIVDENDHVWVIPDDGELLTYARSIDQLRRINLTPLDEFDECGVWIRHVLVEMPENCFSVGLKAARHGFLYGIVLDNDEVETRRVIRFRQPGR
jgi:hypothetical protein